MECLAQLHYRKPEAVVHRDLKPSNIIVSERGHVKLVDLDISKVLYNTLGTKNTGLGTAHYAAPEQYKEHCKISTAIDIWAWSIIVNQMFTRKVPYDR